MQQVYSANHDAFFQWTNPGGLPDANFRGYFYVLDDFGDTIPNSSATPKLRQIDLAWPRCR